MNDLACAFILSFQSKLNLHRKKVIYIYIYITLYIYNIIHQTNTIYHNLIS